MKNKKIITEVSRIQDIMGIKSIINESFWDDLIMLGVKAGKNVDPSLITKSAADEIVIGGVKVSDELSTLLKKEIKGLNDNTTTLKQSVDDVLNLSKKTDPKVYEKLVDSIFNSEKLYESLVDLVGDAEIAIKNLVKEKGFSLQKAYDEVMENVIAEVKNSNMVPDSLIPKITKEVADSVKAADETLKVASSSKIPKKNSMTLEDGTKVSDIFDTSKWEEVVSSLSDEEILLLANPKWSFNPKIAKRLKEIAGFVDERANKIKKIAAARTKTTDTRLYGKLDTQLKKEMETLYKRSNNQFVAIRDYLDDVASKDPEFKRVWKSMTKDTNGGWDFYKLWGKTAKHVPAWDQFWKGITDDLSSVWKITQKGEYSINPIKALKGDTDKVLRDKIKANISNLFKSGSKRGFPWGKSLKNYKELVDKYGAKSAKVAYARDVILNSFKINLVLSIVPIMGGVAMSWLMRDDFKACTKNLEVKGGTTREKMESRKNQISKKIESCRFLTDATGLNKWAINWALWYRGIEELDKDINPFIEMVKQSIPFAGNKIDTDDEGGMFLLELSTLDPGFVMNVVNSLVEFTQVISSPTKQDAFISGLEGELDELKKQQEEIEKELEGSVIVKPLENEDF